MKGLVLAGGSGTRLRPLTYSGPKQLVPVANKPILHYVIDNLIAAGIREIGIIVSPETGAEIKRSVSDTFGSRADLAFIRQDRPGGLAHAVQIARVFLQNDDFCMYLGDNLIGSGIADAAASFQRDTDQDALLMLKEVPDPRQSGVAIVDDAGRVTGVVEKPANPPSNLALVGIYFFRKSIFDAIDRIKPSARGELEITDAIGLLLPVGRVRFERITSWWLDTGKKDDLLLANDTVLDEWLKPELVTKPGADSHVSGRVRIEAGVTLKQASIRGPAIIGEGAVIENAHVGPYTAIGDGVTIRRARVEHSVLMQGATIEDVRLADSLIGKRAIVRRQLAADQRPPVLLIGDDCVVEVDGRW